MNYLIGIDEAGRGPVAGPVSVGICVLKDKYKIFFKDYPFGSDSKKMTEKERVYWYTKIKEAKTKKILDFKVVLKSSKLIDKKGISFAIFSAISEGLKSLKLKPKEVKVLLDGLLKAPPEFKNQKTIIKGDEKEFVISLASVVAKVERDSFITRKSRLYPEYLFEKHKGYGTKDHYIKIKKYGLSDLHRKTYLKRFYR